MSGLVRGREGQVNAGVHVDGQDRVPRGSGLHPSRRCSGGRGLSPRFGRLAPHGTLPARKR